MRKEGISLMKQSQGINVPGAFEHLFPNVRSVTALFPDMCLVEELVGGEVEGRGNR